MSAVRTPTGYCWRCSTRYHPHKMMLRLGVDLQERPHCTHFPGGCLWLRCSRNKHRLDSIRTGVACYTKNRLPGVSSR